MLTNEEGKYQEFYVTTGVHFSNIAMAEKIATFCNEDKTPIQIAKEMRKSFADNCENHGWAKGTKFIPSQLFYAIYEHKNDTVPIFYSDNTPKKFIFGGYSEEDKTKERI